MRRFTCTNVIFFSVLFFHDVTRAYAIGLPPTPPRCRPNETRAAGTRPTRVDNAFPGALSTAIAPRDSRDTTKPAP